MNAKAEAVTTRGVARVVRGMPTSDGAGVKLTRVIGQPQLERAVYHRMAALNRDPRLQREQIPCWVRRGYSQVDDAKARRAAHCRHVAEIDRCHRPTDLPVGHSRKNMSALSDHIGAGDEIDEAHVDGRGVIPRADGVGAFLLRYLRQDAAHRLLLAHLA